MGEVGLDVAIINQGCVLWYSKLNGCAYLNLDRYRGFAAYILIRSKMN